jgi:hypothetical protein
MSQAVDTAVLPAADDRVVGVSVGLSLGQRRSDGHRPYADRTAGAGFEECLSP